MFSFLRYIRDGGIYFLLVITSWVFCASIILNQYTVVEKKFILPGAIITFIVLNAIAYRRRHKYEQWQGNS